MNPTLFSILNNSAAVKAVLGSNPLRFFPWGRATQDTQKPYAVYSVYNGNPENYLGNIPDIDNKGTQINIYGDTSASVQAAYMAIRDTLEPIAHMTSFTTPDLDAQTDLYSCRMEFDFWDER